MKDTNEPGMTTEMPDPAEDASQQLQDGYVDEYADPFLYDPDGQKKREYDAAHGNAVDTVVDMKKEKRRKLLLYGYGAVIGIFMQPVIWQSYIQCLAGIIPIPMEMSMLLFYGIGVFVVLLMMFLLTRMGNSVTGVDIDRIKFSPLFIYMPFMVLLMVSLYVPGKLVPIITMSAALVLLVILLVRGSVFTRKLFGPVMAIMLILALGTNIYSKLMEKNVDFEAEFYILTNQHHGTDTYDRKYIYSEEKLDEYIVNGGWNSSELDFVQSFAHHDWPPSGASVVSKLYDDDGKRNLLGKTVYEAIMDSQIKYDKSFFERYNLMIFVYNSDGLVSDIKLRDMKENHQLAMVTADVTYEMDEAGINETEPDDIADDYTEPENCDIVIALIRVKKGEVPDYTFVGSRDQ